MFKVHLLTNRRSNKTMRKLIKMPQAVNVECESTLLKNESCPVFFFSFTIEILGALYHFFIILSLEYIVLFEQQFTTFKI